MNRLKPTDAELEILNVLWENGPCTVREVYQALNKTRKTGYTTALKLMQIMTEKGLVKRDESQRAHVYEAHIRREDTQRQLVSDLVERVFGGSAMTLVMQALSSKKTSAAEIEQIRKLLDQYDKDRP